MKWETKEKFEAQMMKFPKMFEKNLPQLLQNSIILKGIFENPEGKYERKFGRT